MRAWKWGTLLLAATVVMTPGAVLAQEVEVPAEAEAAPAKKVPERLAPPPTGSSVMGLAAFADPNQEEEVDDVMAAFNASFTSC